MNPLGGRALIGLAGLFIAMAALIFPAAGTFDYWQAWTFLADYFACSIAVTYHLMVSDPALLQRRMGGGPFAEKEPTQQLIMALLSVGFVGLLVVPGLDHRFGWSRMTAAAALMGDLATTLGWLAIHIVFRVNTFTASTIQIAADQHVVSTGPYALVRHPMYAGSFFMLGGIPIALGSWSGFVIFIAMIPGIIWRIRHEERFLLERLQGYGDYCNKVRYRLIPGLW